MHKYVWSMRGLRTLDHKSIQLEVVHSLIACQPRRPVHIVAERSKGSLQSEGVFSEQGSKGMTCEEDVSRETAHVILSQESVTSTVIVDNPVSNAAAQAILDRTMMHIGRTTYSKGKMWKEGPNWKATQEDSS